MLIAWHDESFHSLLLSAWSRMRFFPIPAPGDPSGNTYVGPADWLIWPLPFKHTDKTAVLAGANASACPQTVWGHMFCPHEGNILGLIPVKSPLFPFFLEGRNFCFAASHKYRKLTGVSSQLMEMIQWCNPTINTVLPKAILAFKCWFICLFLLYEVRKLYPLYIKKEQILFLIMMIEPHASSLLILQIQDDLITKPTR